MKKLTSILTAGIYMVLAVLFGVAVMALFTMLTGDLYGTFMGAIFSATIIALIWKC